MRTQACGCTQFVPPALPQNACRLKRPSVGQQKILRLDPSHYRPVTEARTCSEPLVGESLPDDPHQPCHHGSVEDQPVDARARRRPFMCCLKGFVERRGFWALREEVSGRTAAGRSRTAMIGPAFVGFQTSYAAIQGGQRGPLARSTLGPRRVTQSGTLQSTSPTVLPLPER
jgi:hypothetical protein